MDNYVLRNRDSLRHRNYIRKADPNQGYWFDFSRRKLQEYIGRFGEEFNLVIAGSPHVEADFYVIPFCKAKYFLTEEYLSNDREERMRWVGNVINGQFHINGCSERLNINRFYGDPGLLSEGSLAPLHNEDEQNDYAIENMRRELLSRQKQSQFRRMVLLNFGNQCCISDVKETDLLVASHIIPWAARIATRLDPHNGLCLFSPFDSLFDKGYFSFSAEYRVNVTNRVDRLSTELRGMLLLLEGREMRQPNSYPVLQAFLKYHHETRLLR